MTRTEAIRRSLVATYLVDDIPDSDAQQFERQLAALGFGLAHMSPVRARTRIEGTV